MKKILITGGQGFFGSRFAKYYEHKYDVLALGSKDLDVTDEAAVDKAIGDFKPDIIIHAGAIAVTNYCNEHPDIAHKINVDGSVYIAKAAKKYGSKLVFCSTEQIFNGNQNSGPFKEDDEAVPNTVYGANKLEAEGLLRDIIDELWIVRFTWMFSLPERNTRLANNILMDTLSHLRKGEQIIVSKREFRGMTYVYEAIVNMEKLFELPYDTYHFGAENNESRYDIVVRIMELLGLADRIPEVVVEDTVHYLDSPRDVRLDSSKIAELGATFTKSYDAIELCLKEFGLIK